MTVVESDREAAAVSAWRYEMLLALGVSVGDALRLSYRLDVDWHELERMIRAGCDPTVAVRIVE